MPGLIEAIESWATPGKKHQLLKVDDFNVFYQIDDLTNPAEIFIGRTLKKNSPDRTAAIWQITRISTVTGEIIREGALNSNDEFVFDQIWDDRKTIFPALPFTVSRNWIFDGVNNQVSTSAILPGTGAFTIAMWVRRNDLAGQQILLTNLTGSGIDIRINSANTMRFRTDNGGFNNLTSNTNLDSNSVWYFLVFTRAANGDKRIYINGVVDASTSNDGSLDVDNAATTFIGVSPSSSDFLSARMVQASVWLGSALTPLQISELYNLGSPIDLINTFTGPNPNRWYRAEQTVLPTSSNAGSDLGADATHIGFEEDDIGTLVPGA